MFQKHKINSTLISTTQNTVYVKLLLKSLYGISIELKQSSSKNTFNYGKGKKVGSRTQQSLKS